MHFAGFSGWCLGQVFLHTHWHFSSSNSLLGPQDAGISLFLHVHWHDDLSNSLWGPQLEGRTPPLQTHWQVSSSSSLFGPQIWNPSDVSGKAAEKSTSTRILCLLSHLFLCEQMSKTIPSMVFQKQAFIKRQQQPGVAKIQKTIQTITTTSCL